MYKDLNDYELLYLICDDNEGYNIIFSKYKPLIYKISCKYLNICKKFGMELDDIMQIGYISLLKASSYYYENHDNLFYTYLVRVVENAIITEIRKNCTSKKLALNNSISYDTTIPNSDKTYLDLIVDPKSDFAARNLSYDEYYLISLKNSFSFDIACVFELKFNGYNIKEISLLLKQDIKVIRNYLQVIKRYSVNDISY